MFVCLFTFSIGTKFNSLLTFKASKEYIAMQYLTELVSLVRCHKHIDVLCVAIRSRKRTYSYVGRASECGK